MKEAAREEAWQEFESRWKATGVSISEVSRPFMKGAFFEGYEAASRWVAVESVDDLPQWPKNYLWQWTNAKGQVLTKVQRFTGMQREWFASVFDAWMELPEPYQEKR